mmetsp:Transcript_141/g.364  ORF Transcript_141/g.364 Transcript_141/m.364 type:complete len:1111 (+) Transcript_141:25-3357(+)
MADAGVYSAALRTAGATDVTHWSVTERAEVQRAAIAAKRGLLSQVLPGVDTLALVSQSRSKSVVKQAVQVEHCVVSPTSSTFILWVLLLIVFCSVDLVLIPAVWGFSHFEASFVANWRYWAGLTDVLLICDLLLHLTTIVAVTDQPHPTRRSLLKQYLRTWFLPDLLAALPFGLAGLSGWARGARFVRVPRIAVQGEWLTMVRLVHLFPSLMVLRRVLPLLGVLGYVLHWNACLVGVAVAPEVGGRWPFGGEVELESENQVYIMCLQQAFSCLTTAEFPTANTEHLTHMLALSLYLAVLSMAMLVGATVPLAWVGATVLRETVENTQAVHEIRGFLHQVGLASRLRARVMLYVRRTTRTGTIRSAADVSTFRTAVTGKVSGTLFSRIFEELYRDVLLSFPLFHELSEIRHDFVGMMSSACQVEIYMPSDVIWHEGAVASSLCMLRHGLVRMSSVGDGAGVVFGPEIGFDGRLGVGFVGECALLREVVHGVPSFRTSTLACMTWTETLAITRAGFDAVAASLGVSQVVRSWRLATQRDSRRKIAGAGSWLSRLAGCGRCGNMYRLTLAAAELMAQPGGPRGNTPAAYAASLKQWVERSLEEAEDEDKALVEAAGVVDVHWKSTLRGAFGPVQLMSSMGDVEIRTSPNCTEAQLTDWLGFVLGDRAHVTPPDGMVDRVDNRGCVTLSDTLQGWEALLQGRSQGDNPIRVWHVTFNIFVNPTAVKQFKEWLKYHPPELCPLVAHELDLRSEYKQTGRGCALKHNLLEREILPHRLLRCSLDGIDNTVGTAARKHWGKVKIGVRMAVHVAKDTPVARVEAGFGAGDALAVVHGQYDQLRVAARATAELQRARVRVKALAELVRVGTEATVRRLASRQHSRRHTLVDHTDPEIGCPSRSPSRGGTECGIAGEEHSAADGNRGPARPVSIGATSDGIDGEIHTEDAPADEASFRRGPVGAGARAPGVADGEVVISLGESDPPDVGVTPPVSAPVGLDAPPGACAVGHGGDREGDGMVIGGRVGGADAAAAFCAPVAPDAPSPPVSPPPNAPSSPSSPLTSGSPPDVPHEKFGGCTKRQFEAMVCAVAQALAQYEHHKVKRKHSRSRSKFLDRRETQ